MVTRPDATCISRSSRGLTLLEIVMVLVIISLAVLSIAPNIAENIEASGAVRARQILISWARWAQNAAITEQRPYRIIFDDPGDSYTIQKFNGAVFVDIETVILGEYVNLRAVTFPSSILEFNQFGAPVPSGGGLELLNREWFVSAFTVESVTGKMTML